MLKTFDGTSYRRVGGKLGDRVPQTGFQRLRSTYTATGGETSVDLSLLTPAMSYMPGQNQLTVKRSSGGAMIVGLDYQELTPTSIGFSGDPLIAGEVVEFIREFSVTGVLAVQPRTDMYTATATVGQILVSADFSWQYNMNSTKGVGAVEVYLNGVLQTRGVDYSEVNLSTANTNQITFVDPLLGGENIIVKPTYQVIDQTAATSTFNSQQLANVQGVLTAGSQAFVDQSATIAVPSTTIIGRARIPNLAADLRANMGIDRIDVSQILDLQNEFGVNGERVFAAMNDDRGLIRFVGSWVNQTSSVFAGPYPFANVVDSYVEITFYGTGLNMGTVLESAPKDIRISIDGGAETLLSYPTTYSSVLAGRLVKTNQNLTVASGLTLGVHTVKIRLNSVNNLQIQCFEIINSSANVAINPGTAYANGQKLSLATAASLAYNTGVTGIRGGRQLVYLKQDGTIGNSFQTVDATQKDLTLADHTNEEIARQYNFREFGAGRSDDFSTNGIGSVQRAFTLDDGTTTLVLGGGNNQTISNGEFIGADGVGSFWLFTFVGTGLDILRVDSGTAGTATNSVMVDGVTTGTLNTASSTTPRQVKIVSGLPYGTHTVRVSTAGAGSNHLGVRAFMVYQPKKPALPAGAVELADYNVLATYAVNPVVQFQTPAIGVLRKQQIREFNYVSAGWSITGLDSSFASGQNLFVTTAAGAYFEYTFFGTGVEMKHYFNSGTAYNFTISIDGSSNLSAYTTSIALNGTTGVTFVAATGLVSGTAATATTYGNTTRVTGLPLGLHKVRITQNSTGVLYADAIDVVTPIHSHKNNGLADLQNTLPVGNQGISDNRKTSMIKEVLPVQKAWAQATGVSVSPTSTISATFVPIPDMSVTIKTNGGPLDISYALRLSNTAIATVQTVLAVDGVSVAPQQDLSVTVAGSVLLSSNSIIVPVSAGTHKIDLYWSTTTGTMSAPSTSRLLTVKEI